MTTIPLSLIAAAIPPLDEFGLPGPVWIFQLLLPATFFLHVLFMNIALGTALLLGPLWLLSRKRPLLTHVVRRLLGVWPVAISLTITTGVAPLLFVQVLYGHLFYTSNILLGWTWLAILGLLLAAFYAVYLVKRWAPPPEPAPASASLFAPLLFIGLIALAFLTIAAIFTANSVLMLRPDIWADVHAGRTSPWSAHGMLWPRFLHNVIGSLAVTSMFIAILSRVDRRLAAADRAPVAGFGLLWAWIFTSAQIATGVWFLVVVWSDAGPALQTPTPGTVLWAMAILSGLLSWLTMLRGLERPERPWAVWAPAGLIAFTLAGMSAGRERVRLGLLAGHANALYGSAEVHTQASVLWLFVLVLLGGLATLTLVLHWTYHARPAETG